MAEARALIKTPGAGQPVRRASSVYPSGMGSQVLCRRFCAAKKGANVWTFAPSRSRTPGANRYRCSLSGLTGLAATPPPGSCTCPFMGGCGYSINTFAAHGKLIKLGIDNVQFVDAARKPRLVLDAFPSQPSWGLEEEAEVWRIKKAFLAARMAAAAQRKNSKTTFFGFFPLIPARTAG